MIISGHPHLSSQWSEQEDDEEEEKEWWQQQIQHWRLWQRRQPWGRCWQYWVVISNDHDDQVTTLPTDSFASEQSELVHVPPCVLFSLSWFWDLGPFDHAFWGEYWISTLQSIFEYLNNISVLKVVCCYSFTFSWCSLQMSSKTASTSLWTTPNRPLHWAWFGCLGMMIVEMLDNAKNSTVNGGSKNTCLKIMSDVIWIFFCESRTSRSILNLRGGLSCFYVSYRSLENMTTWPFGIYSLSTAPLKLGQYPKKSIKAQPSWI